MKSFEKLAGVSAVLAGLSAFLYAVAFVVISRSNIHFGGLLSALFLLFLGLLAISALIALYERVQAISSGFTLWALIMGIGGAFGAAIHGAYDLANSINPPASIVTDLPSQIDPRGLMTFAFAGIAIFLFSWLINKAGTFSRGFVWWGYLAGLLLIIIYLGRLIILTPTSPFILYPVLLSGFLVNPVWYIWLGITLLKARD